MSKTVEYYYHDEYEDDREYSRAEQEYLQRMEANQRRHPDDPDRIDLDEEEVE